MKKTNFSYFFLVIFIFMVSFLVGALGHRWTHPVVITFSCKGLVERQGRVESIPLWVGASSSRTRDGFYEAFCWDVRPLPGAIPVSPDYYYKTWYPWLTPGPHGEKAVIVDFNQGFSRE